MREAVVQAEEAAAEIIRKPEKQEKKFLKKENKQLAAIALLSSEKSNSTPKECEEISERPQKKKKQKSQEAPEDGIEDPLSALPKPKKKKSFSKGGQGSNDFEDSWSVSFPKMKKSFPREEHAN
uniref:Uncharacterized protein n=1 Tax=Loxodonta africana TaxID=9785 RepID=G3UFS0_LOXAF